MKQIVLFFLAVMAFAACSSDKKAPFNYRGLSFTIPANQLVDSMLARGFAVD